MSRALVRFFLGSRTSRAEVWETFCVELEQERLKALARTVGWTVGTVYVDPGPHLADSERPFRRLAADLAERSIDTILVTDTSTITRKDLRFIWDQTEEHGADVVLHTPHVADENLAFDDIDYDAVPDSDADHRPLERIWTRDATDAMHKLFAAVGWNWTHYAADVLSRALGVEVMRSWRDSDRLAQRENWRNVLTRYAIARARRTGDLENLALPKLEICRHCRRAFVDAAVPVRLAELTSRDSYCCRCLRRAFFWDRSSETEGLGPGPDSPAHVDAFTSRFREIGSHGLQRFMETVLRSRDDVEMRGTRESASNVWLGALSEIGLLDELGDITKTDSYYRAGDGHLSSSLGAALLDNWLVMNDCEHRRDARYPGDEELNPTMTLRADFAVGEVLVEFFGLRGRDDLGKDPARRLAIAERGGRRVVGFFAEDLLVREVLEQRMAGVRDPPQEDIR